MFNTLKYFKHIVITGDMPDTVLSDLLDCTKHEITDNFDDLHVKSIIFPKFNSIPFDKLDLENTFFIAYDDSYLFDKVKYGYKHLKAIPDNLKVMEFNFYHSHLGNRKVLHFDCENEIQIDLINNNQVTVDLKAISKDELRLLRANFQKFNLFYKQGLSLSDKIKGESFNLKLKSIHLDDLTYLLITIKENEIFPFRFQGITDFSFKYYQLKLKQTFAL